MAREVYWWKCIWAWTAILALSSPLAAGGGIKGEPRVTEKWESRKVVREGESVKLLCPITGSPEPFFEWSKGTEAVKTTWERYTTKKHTLRIKLTQVTDSGTYHCYGVNGFGKAEASMHLIVLGKNEPNGDVSIPILTMVWPEGNQQRRIGEPLTLTCKAKGLPTPTVAWFKDDLSLGKIGDQLTFNGLQSTDTGIYTCKASSSLGVVTANFSINVLEPKKEPELDISEAVNQTVFEGESTSLQCTVRTSHTPEVQWLKKVNPESFEGGKIPNKTIPIGNQHYRRVETAAPVVAKGGNTYLSKLTIVRAVPEDAGIYACLGANNLGYDYREAHLTVLSRRDGVQRAPPVGPKEKNINWFFLIIPAVVILVVVVVAIMCQMRKTAPDKPVGVSPPTPVLKGDDTSALAPLNPDSHGHLPRPPDLVYQEVSGYPGNTMRGPHTNNYKDQYPSPYPDSYPESYPEPAYSDPYSGERGPTRASEHSYARLTHPSHPSHPSLASHPSHTSHASSSPHLPPPYAHTHVHGHAHSHSHTHRHPQYFVHYNL